MRSKIIAAVVLIAAFVVPATVAEAHSVSYPTYSGTLNGYGSGGYLWSPLPGRIYMSVASVAPGAVYKVRVYQTVYDRCETWHVWTPILSLFDERTNVQTAAASGTSVPFFDCTQEQDHQMSFPGGHHLRSTPFDPYQGGTTYHSSPG